MKLYLLEAVMLGFIQVVTTSVSSTKFTKIQPSVCGPVRLSNGWVDRSRSSCASNCKARYPQECNSFLYNKSTKACIPANGLGSNQPLPSLGEGDLYHYQYPDFSKFPIGSNTVNLAYFTKPLIYTDAESACRCLDAHLYSPDSWDKIWFIGNVAIPRYYMWIGLNDMAVEGKFVWAKNVQEIEAVYKIAIFKPGQPDNGYNGNQDCVFLTPDSYEFDDGDCFEQKAYICEKPTLNNSSA
ncbi:unnamed protein product [Lymnaea stagnalis]|uniref:C-type lectin domain-containing protein n=1 Tax=Lymnaea stagnalis TaxID=6523 RepID=A0AAV2IAN1_LYMST